MTDPTTREPRSSGNLDPDRLTGAVFIGRIPEAEPPTVKVHHLQLVVAADTPMLAFAHAGAQLHLGPPLDERTMVIAAESPAELVQFLLRAVIATIAVDPTALPASPGPQLLKEARAAIVEDLLRSLGIPADGLPTEISEVAVTDVRTARRIGELVRQQLDTAIDEYPTLSGLIANAVAAA